MEIDRPSTTVFYDGSCPLCRAEIGHYGRQTGSTALSFVDVSLPRPDGTTDVITVLTQQQAMARFHVQLSTDD